DESGNINKVIGDEPIFSVVDESTYNISWKSDYNSEIDIICKESQITIKEKSFIGDKKGIALYFNKIPVIKNVQSKEIICEHNNFKYSLYLLKGEFLLSEDSTLLIISENNEISLSVFKGEKELNNEFLSSEYLVNRKEIDEYIPKYKKGNSKSKIIPKGFRPEIYPKSVVLEKFINQEFNIYNPNKNGEVRYTLDDSEPNDNSLLYTKSIVLKESTTIKAKAFKNGFKESDTSTANLYSSLKIKDIKTFTNPVNIKKYNKNGVYDLIDQKKGSDDYTDGCWLGYHDDLDVIVDLGEEKNISKITIGFLQDTRAWIYYPRFVDFKVSVDGNEFKDSKRIYHENSIPRKEVAVENISVNYEEDIKVRYIRMFAKNEEVCPPWSIMAGEGPAFMFVDQITIE
ncbi:FN3 associated domain-containing protein, partial [Clostridium sp.]|uniref:FN3 associated domain-containing protein n=1 Tax=Clostridium sp. TaxID=1506 RepID=UPI00261F60D9